MLLPIKPPLPSNPFNVGRRFRISYTSLNSLKGGYVALGVQALGV